MIVRVGTLLSTVVMVGEDQFDWRAPCMIAAFPLGLSRSPFLFRPRLRLSPVLTGVLALAAQTLRKCAQRLRVSAISEEPVGAMKRGWTMAEANCRRLTVPNRASA